jgi:hypothetical protein
MLQFIFNQINQASNNASIDEQKIEKYQKKINKYNDKLQYIQLQETAGGAFSFGIKLFVFNDKDFPDINKKNKYDFHSTDDLAKKIGEKSYIVELGSDKANIFLSNIQVIERKMKKMKKQNLFLSSDSLSLSNTLNDKNHKAIFEEIRKDIPSGNFNRYVLINFGMTKNNLIELSDVMKTNDTPLSETSATPDTYSSVQFNDSKVKSNNTPFIKQETSYSPTSSAPVPARHVSNISTTSNSSNYESVGGAFSYGIKLFVFNDKDFSDIDRKNKYDFHSTDVLAKKIGEKSYIVELGSDKANVFLSNIQAVERKMKKMKKQNLFLSYDSLSLSNTLNDKNHKAIFEEIRKDVPSSNFNRYVLINFGMIKNSLIELSDVMKTNDTPFIKQGISDSPTSSAPVPARHVSNLSTTSNSSDNINNSSQTSSAPVPVRSVSNLSTTSNSSDNINNSSQTSSASIPVRSVSNLSTTSNSSDNNNSITSSASIPVRSVSNLSTTSNSSDNKITNTIKPSDNKAITAQPIKGNIRYYTSSLNLLL